MTLGGHNSIIYAPVNIADLWWDCVSTNDTGVAHYNFDTDKPILIVVGTDVAERVYYRTVIRYPISPD